MLKFNFSGRPDGLGNRIEQVIMLEGLCLKKNININYIWKNQYSNRTYDILFSSNLVEINKEPLKDIEYKWEGVDPEELDLYKHLNQKEILSAANLIKPKFKIQFDCQEKPIGIHVRGTDRIGINHPHFMKDYDEFNKYISKTIALINNLKPKFVYICSDNPDYKKIFRKKLNRKITIVNPICNPEIPEVYRDLFALSMCDSIYMCSKFSTFSIVASLIGNATLTSYDYDKIIVERYKSKYNFDLGFTGVKIKNYIVDPSKSRKALIERYKFRIKTFLIKWFKILLNIELRGRRKKKK